MTALAILLEKARSQSELARRIGASQQRISYWLAKGKDLPAEFVLKAEAEFNIPRHELRPDIYPVEAATQPAGAV